MYVGAKQTANTVAFLKSEKVVSFTYQVDDTYDHVDTVNGKKIIKAGNLLMNEADTAPIGIIYNDVDVTHGPAPVAVIVEGHVLFERLPNNTAVQTNLAALATQGIYVYNADTQERMTPA